MKRRNLTPQENSANIEFNVELGAAHCVLREESVVDEFYFESHKPSDDCCESVSFVDPIIMLFNQERLDNMGSTAAKAFLDSLTPKSNSLSELRKQCSDDDLMKMIKSRHLQSPAEILHWCRYIEDNIEEFNNEVAKLQAEQQAQEQQQATSSVEQTNS